MTKLLQIKTNVSLFQDFLPVLVGHFTDLCLEFKAGQIGACFAAWKELTKDGILLSYVRGTKIELLEELM